MAMTDCPECGKDISTEARHCPHCGCPSVDMPLSESLFQAWWHRRVVLGIKLCVLAGAVSVMLGIISGKADTILTGAIIGVVGTIVGIKKLPFARR